MQSLQNAGEFMGGLIRQLAENRPDLCDQSGRGFWPVPALFPGMLADTLSRLQGHIGLYYIQGETEAAEFLAGIRVDFMRVVYEGDLGENHTALYLQDHPGVRKLDFVQARALPFGSFCDSVRKQESAFVRLGILSRNEEGSLEEARALAETGLLAPDGVFAKVHLVEEEVHGQIAAQIREKLIEHPLFGKEFRIGMQAHDNFYRTILRNLG